MSARLLLDEHFSQTIAEALRSEGHDVTAVVADPELRGLPDAEVFRRAADEQRRIVTENVKDFRPLPTQAYDVDQPVAQILLVPPSRLPRGAARRSSAALAALRKWLTRPDAAERPDEDWLV